MKNKRIVGALLLLLIFSTNRVYAMKEFAATTFSDLSIETDYFEGIDWAVENGVTMGYGDRTWRPNSCVTRAEIVKMAFEAVPGEEIDFKKSYVSPFKDVKYSDWYYHYANRAKELGYVDGYADGSFKGGECLNRAEALKITVKMMINNPSLDNSNGTIFCGDNKVKDLDGNSWYAPYARLLVANELVGLNHTGLYSDKKNKIKKSKVDITYLPADSMSRGEVVEMLYLLKNSDKYNK